MQSRDTLQTTGKIYVLVQFPEDTSYFEENNIGYPSYESEDNGARFVSEEDYIKVFGHEPDAAGLYRAVCWPEIQELQEDAKFETYSEVIQDEAGINDFGPSAYWIPVCYS